MSDLTSSLTIKRRDLEATIEETVIKVKEAEDKQLEAALSEDFELADSLSTSIDSLNSEVVSLRSKLSEASAETAGNVDGRRAVHLDVLAGLTLVQAQLESFKSEQDLDVNSESNEVRHFVNTICAIISNPLISSCDDENTSA